MKKQYKTAVFIGRFQPIHSGHFKTIDTALDLAEQLIIVIGSHNKSRTIKNPFSSIERKDMIENSLLDIYHPNRDTSWKDKPDTTILSRIKFVYVRDYMYNDYKWASEIYSKCLASGASEHKDTVLIGCLKDDSSYYLKMFPQWTFHKMPYLYNLDATHIRNDWYDGQLNNHINNTHSNVIEILDRFSKFNDDKFSNLVKEYNFIRDYKKMWEVAPYPVTFVTVDALVIKSGCVLVIKRGLPLGYNQLALAGGYINQNESIEDAMIRELKEETKITVPNHVLKNSIKEVKVFDHPKRSMRGRIITHVHLIDLGMGALPSVTGNDDASEAMWIPLSDVLQREDEFFEDHFDIIMNMISKY